LTLLTHVPHLPVAQSIAVIVILASIWSAIIYSWRRGLYALACYIPIAGAVSLKLYPAAWPKELSDVLFIIPSYIGFAMRARNEGPLRIPRAILWLIIALAVLVALQSLNPHIPSRGMALIGAKVWLFYLPLLILGYYWLGSRREISSLFRLLMALAWIPSLAGFIQFVGSHALGYVTFMRKFYGPAAELSTQMFAMFVLGGGVMIRLPGTFTFPAQYYNYLLTMTALAFVVGHSDEELSWRRFGNVTFFWLIFASYISGVRTAFVLSPMMALMLYAMSKKRLSETLGMLAICSILILVSLKLPGFLRPQDVTAVKTATARSGDTRHDSGRTMQPPPRVSAPNPTPGKMIDLGPWVTMMRYVVTRYPREIGYQGVKLSIQEAPWGQGTGMNTTAARYAAPSFAQVRGLENYYAKAIFELGILGGLVVMTLFGFVVVYGWRIYQKVQGLEKTVAAAIFTLTLLFALYGFKGCLLDLDPINMYFWILSGLLFRLPHLPKNDADPRRAERTFTL
jgi:hypothetical protein